MPDCQNYHQQLMGPLTEIGVIPETVADYQGISEARQNACQPEAKTRTIHTGAVVKHGASSEVADTQSVAIALNAGAAVACSTSTTDEFAAHRFAVVERSRSDQWIDAASCGLF